MLDLGLPDRDGRDVLRELRGWSDVPVIVLTVRFAEDEKVAALDAGANDYVTKPFGVKELLARSRAPAARARQRSEPVAAGLRRRPPARRPGAPRGLRRRQCRWSQPQGIRTAGAAGAHAGRVVTQPQLLREIWGPTHEQDTHYLRILVGKLRQKLGDDATHPRWILTEPGVGLRLRT